MPTNQTSPMRCIWVPGSRPWSDFRARRPEAGVQRTRLVAPTGRSASVTNRQDGSISHCVVELRAPPPGGTDIGYTSPGLNGPEKSFVLSFPGHGTNFRAKLWRHDRDHGNVIKIFDVIGRPA